MLPEPIKWYCQGFGFLCQEIMIMCRIQYKKYLNISQRQQYYSHLDVRLKSSLMDIICHPCGIFEGILRP